MDIKEFQTLDREKQLAEAGRIAGVDPSVFDGIWRTESGRGASMLSPAGAEGHFGLMPKTRKTLEARFGTGIDPHDFGQSLYASAHLVKENMARFGNLPDALRAYNGGWDPSAWTNPETAAYAGKVLGTDLDEADVGPSTAAAMAHAPVPTAASLWDSPARGIQRRAGAPDLSPVMAAVKAYSDGIEPKAPAAPDYSVVTKINQGSADAFAAERKLKDETSTMDIMRAAAASSGTNQLLGLVFKETYPAMPGYEPKEEELKGYTLEEQRQLRAAKSPQEFNRMAFDIADEKEQSDITFRRGAVFGMGASILSDLPAAAVTGMLASAGMARTGYGAWQLASQGRKAAALGSSFVEGAVGNLAYTAGLDALGKHQGGVDYTLAIAGGMLSPLLEGKAIGRAADKFMEAEVAMRAVEQAAARELALRNKAVSTLGKDAKEEDIIAEVKRLQTEGVRADLAATTAAVPESRKFNVGEEHDLAAAKGEKPAEAGAVTESHAMPADPTGNGLVTHDEPLPHASAARAVYGDNVAAKWEDTATTALREKLLSENPEWQRMFKTMSGMDPTELARIKAGEIKRTPNLDLLTMTDPKLSAAVKAAEDIVREYLPTAKVVFGARPLGANSMAEVASVGRLHVISLNPHITPDDALHSLKHEIGHAIYHQYASKASPRVLKMIDQSWLEFVNDVRAGKADAFEQRHGITSPHHTSKLPHQTATQYNLSRDEYMAEQFTRHLQNRMMRGDFGKLDKDTVESILEGVRKVWQYVKELFTGNQVKAGQGPEEFFSEVLRQSHMKVEKDLQRAAMRVVEHPDGRIEMTAAHAGDIVQQSAAPAVADFLTDPVARKYGLDLLPVGTPALRAEAKQILNLYKRADEWAAANPIDEKRMNKLLSRFDSLDPISNQMLRSENPVLRMVASELLENGGGAAGRRSSAAIAKFMNERAIVGNAINEMEDHFNLWLKGQGGDKVREFLSGQRRVEFNKLVAEEIEQRRVTGQQADFGEHVRNAADAVETSFERARLMQIDAKTVGWASLPETSRGYMPHRMRADVVRSLTNDQRRAVHSALMDQFVENLGFDMSFADNLAAKYLDRVSARALGGFDAPMGTHSTGAPDIVREALEQMNMSRDEVDLMMKRYMQGGAGHTKKRLNLDLRKQYENADGTTFRLLDLFDTDMLSLVRGQSQRVAGEVALARHGVMGKPGMAILRRGIVQPGGKATAKEAEAFDAMAAEFLGQPFGTQNKWVDRAMQANAVASLGGMGFNQMGEIINAATTLGVKKAFSVISSISRMRSEIKALAAGKTVDNAWLSSIEKQGGAEFGTDAYKMVFPLDLPDAPMHTMGADTLSAGDRLLRGAGHVQSKLSFWRAIHSTQQRGVAEEIVKSFAAALHAGKTDVTLADMGLTAEVLERLRADAPNILIRKDGKLVGFDITAATDKDAANQLVQAVHRGTHQIIQGTFIGETGKYVHNSYLKMLAQFRGFGLTAIDKQWNRQKGNRGVAAAFGMTVGAMGAAIPIYMVRTYAASIGRADQQEYLDRQLSWYNIARASTNYIATSGLAGDFVDALSSVAGYGTSGGRSGVNTQLVGNLVAPVLGKVDKVWGSVQNTKDGTDVHGFIKELPLSRLPWLIPAINALD